MGTDHVESYSDCNLALSVPNVQEQMLLRKIPERDPAEEMLNRKFQIVIDDASHTDLAIINTIESFLPYLDFAHGFVYFIEDNGTVIDEL